MEQKVNVNEISVERLISLERQNASLEQQVGELRSDKKNLEDKIKEGQKEVKIVTGRKSTSNWSDDTYFTIDSVETRNLGDVEEIIRKKYQSDIEKKEKEIRELTNTLEDNKSIYNRSKKALENDYDNYRNDLTIANEKKIKSLKEEIQKLKDDKTDEQLVAARDNEILEYKKQNKELQKVIKDLQSINIFKLIIAKFFKPVIITNNITDYFGETSKTVWDKLYKKWRNVEI
jgi:DNA repair exonuclease SbcCD ATPase subunit